LFWSADGIRCTKLGLSICEAYPCREEWKIKPGCFYQGRNTVSETLKSPEVCMLFVFNRAQQGFSYASLFVAPMDF